MSDQHDTKAFDPSRYLVKLRGRDYIEVKWRLVWLRTEHPDAAIETEMVSLDTERQFCVFKARVAIPGGGSATGWGQEEAADFGDYLEKAETKAIGRALGALGYGTQFTEDFEFADGGEQRVVDSPVERAPRQQQQDRYSQPTASRLANATINDHGARPVQNDNVRSFPPSGTPSGRPETRPALPATEPQIKAVTAIARAQGMDERALQARIHGLFGISDVYQLSRRQASELIDLLKKDAP